MAASADAQILADLVAYGTPQDVQAVIDKGADVNANSGGRTPLIVAATSNKHPEVIAILVTAGADLEAVDSTYGGTALMWAAGNENPGVIAAVLKAGANPNTRDKNDATALIWAAINSQNPEVIAVLLNAGADAKVKDKQGKTAFYYARYRSSMEDTDALKQLEEASK